MEDLKNRASPGLEKGKHTVSTEKKGKQVVVNNNGGGTERNLHGVKCPRGGERGGIGEKDRSDE